MPPQSQVLCDVRRRLDVKRSSQSLHKRLRVRRLQVPRQPFTQDRERTLHALRLHLSGFVASTGPGRIHAQRLRAVRDHGLVKMSNVQIHLLLPEQTALGPPGSRRLRAPGGACSGGPGQNLGSPALQRGVQRSGTGRGIGPAIVQEIQVLIDEIVQLRPLVGERIRPASSSLRLAGRI